MTGICFNTDFGYVSIHSKANKISYVGFEKQTFEKNNCPVLLSAKQQILEYFSGKRKKFELDIVLNKSEFQRKVLHNLLQIDYGKTLCYSEVAKNIGNEKAVRAVANAIAQNPIAIIIPCHRVIGKNGKLSGYLYGTWIKQKLLDLEQSNVF